MIKVSKIDKKNAPYVLTKPFHHSQELLERKTDGSVLIKIRVHHNFEIERLILGFGKAIEVINPRAVRRRIHWKVINALKQYELESKDG